MQGFYVHGSNRFGFTRPGKRLSLITASKSADSTAVFRFNHDRFTANRDYCGSLPIPAGKSACSLLLTRPTDPHLAQLTWWRSSRPRGEIQTKQDQQGPDGLPYRCVLFILGHDFAQGMGLKVVAAAAFGLIWAAPARSAASLPCPPDGPCGLNLGCGRNRWFQWHNPNSGR